MTEIRPRTIYSVPDFSMTSAVSIIRPDVPAFATRSAEGNIHHDRELGDRENMISIETYAYYHAFLLIMKTA